MTLALLLLSFLFASTIRTIAIRTTNISTTISNSKSTPISSPHQPHLHFTPLDLYSSQVFFGIGQASPS